MNTLRNSLHVIACVEREWFRLVLEKKKTHFACNVFQMLSHKRHPWSRCAHILRIRSSVLRMACNLSVVVCTNNSITRRATIIPFSHSLSQSTRFFLAARVDWVWYTGKDRMNSPRMLINWSLNTFIVLSSLFFKEIFRYNGNKPKKPQQVLRSTLKESREIVIVLEIMCFLYNPKVAFNTPTNS